MTSNDPLHLLGETVGGRYAIDSLVRREPGSLVYRATHLASNRSVGVRVLTALASVSESRRAALLESLTRDQVKLAELGGIVPAAYPIRDVGTVAMPHGAWVPYVVLAWPHGLTLRQLLTSASAELPESLADVAALLEPVAVALAIAHEHGVVHGGITPDRVLFRDHVDGSRRPVLLDFGAARVLRGAGVQEAGDATAEDDVRALAGVLSQTFARSCGADGNDGLLTPRGRGVVVDDELEAVFAQAFSGDSFVGVGDFWAALRRALRLAPLRSLEATIPPEVPSLVTSSSSLHPTAHSTPPAASGGASPLLGRLAYAAMALVVVGLGALTVRRAGAIRPHVEAVTAPAVLAAPPPPRSPCPAGMVSIGEATFRTGVAGDADDPARDVALRAFCLDRDAVATSDYKACSDRGDCKRASRTNEWDGIADADHQALDPLCTARDPQGLAARPVNCVTWEMAAIYCADRGARLPTEAEWAVASRTVAAPVAEWVADWHAPIAAGEPQVDPHGPSDGDERVVRGAHAAGAPSSRFGAAPTTRSHAIGFRCAQSL